MSHCPETLSVEYIIVQRPHVSVCRYPETPSVSVRGSLFSVSVIPQREVLPQEFPNVISPQDDFLTDNSK